MISALFYKIFLVLGLVVSFEDWTEKKIRNRWIGTGLVLCGAGFAYLILNSFMGYRRLAGWGGGFHYLPWRYYPRVLEHAFLCVIGAMTLWRFNIWPAGDAKLFILFGLFTAIIDPNIPGFPLLLFMIMLINVFVPPGIFFAAETVLRVLPGVRVLVQTDWVKRAKAAGEQVGVRVRDAWPYRFEYANLTVNLVALFFGMIVLGAKFSRLAMGPFSQLLIFVAILIIWSRAMKLLQNKTAGFLALLALSAVLVGGTAMRHWYVWGWLVSALKMTFNFGLFISFARMAFDWFIEWDSRRELDPENLHPGVVLSDETWYRLKDAEGLKDKLSDRYSDGLTAEEVETLKAWLAGRGGGAGDGGQPYSVYHTIPFAVWIFMGTLLTLYRRGSVLVILLPYYMRVKGVLTTAIAGWFS